MGMQVTNTTKYRTDDLRKFLRAIIVEAGMDPRENWRITVEFVRNKRYWDCVKGYAYYNSRTFSLRIPFGWGTIGNDAGKLKSMAQVVHHEIDHCRNVRHTDMVPVSEIQTAVWEGHQIRIKVEKKKPPMVDRAAKRRAHAEIMAENWAKKLRTAKRCLKKWERKVRYYERAADRKAAGENKGDGRGGADS